MPNQTIQGNKESATNRTENLSSLADTKSASSLSLSISIWNKVSNYPYHVKNLHDYVKEEIRSEGSQHERIYANGIRIIIYSNLASKEIMPIKNFSPLEDDSIDASLLGHIFYYYSNGHIKEVIHFL